MREDDTAGVGNWAQLTKFLKSKTYKLTLIHRAIVGPQVSGKGNIITILVASTEMMFRVAILDNEVKVEYSPMDNWHGWFGEVLSVGFLVPVLQ